ncbi:MAG: M3 family metallopeptidase [Pseudomonadota bacterium]
MSDVLSDAVSENPLLAPWHTPYALPPFDRIEPAHFMPAFERGMAEHRAEIEAVKADPAPPSGANVIDALDQAGRALDRVAAVFFNLAGSHTSPELQAVEREIAPKLSKHSSAIMLDVALFARVEAVPEEGLTPQQARVRTLMLRRFRKSGAALDAEGRARLAEINARLATVGTAFSQTVLKDEADWVMWLGEGDLDGLPGWLQAAAKAEAEGRDRPDAWAITLSRSSIEPFLAFSARRDLREQAWRAWTSRGETGAPGEEGDNWTRIAETLTLRDERARLLGFENYAAWRLSDQMAKTPEAVRDLLDRVWQPARARASAEAAALQALAAGEGANIDLAPWDWRYYAEKERKRLHDIDEAETKPYFSLDSVIEAAFDVAGRLFGLSFRPVEGLALHHPDARAWEVSGPDGAHVGLFIGDYYARPTKRSGAWASGFRGQQKLVAPGRPIIINTMNFAKGAPTLLTFDDARTLFHEFGHALHGLLSDVTYRTIAGTAVARDFVELPSQLYEHWLATPAVLETHARHVETGEPMPAAMIQRLRGAQTFNQGFATVEYCASALVDLIMHTRAPEAAADPRAFEAAVLADIGMPAAISMRHRSPHFQHVFSGEGYSAGYYSYLWSELMDADAFAAFEEAGDVFDPGLADKLATHILSAGGSDEPEALYTAFRGRLPGVEPLLKGRGLLDDAA